MGSRDGGFNMAFALPPSSFALWWMRRHGKRRRRHNSYEMKEKKKTPDSRSHNCIGSLPPLRSVGTRQDGSCQEFVCGVPKVDTT